MGQAAGTFGIKGEMKVLPYTDFPAERFARGKRIFALHEGEYIPLTVRTYRRAGEKTLVSFEEWPDLTAAEPYKGVSLYIDEKESHPLEEGSYYPEQIIGLKAYQGGSFLGEVVDVDFLVKHPVIRIRGQREYLVPFVPAFIASVDLGRGILEIDPGQGLA